jgi:hypothetical protein
MILRLLPQMILRVLVPDGKSTTYTLTDTIQTRQKVSQIEIQNIMMRTQVKDFNSGPEWHGTRNCMVGESAEQCRASKRKCCTI